MGTARRWASYVVLAGLCLAALPHAHAEPAYTPQAIPPCSKIKLNSGKTLCGYTLPEVKALYKADSELVELRQKKIVLEQKVMAQESMIEKIQRQLELGLSNVRLVTTRNGELTQQLLETDRVLQQERARPMWGSYVAWGVAVAISAAFVGYVVADRVNR